MSPCRDRGTPSASAPVAECGRWISDILPEICVEECGAVDECEECGGKLEGGVFSCAKGEDVFEGTAAE